MILNTHWLICHYPCIWRCWAFSCKRRIT